jgi:hypothetical protein
VLGTPLLGGDSVLLGSPSSPPPERLPTSDGQEKFPARRNKPSTAGWSVPPCPNPPSIRRIIDHRVALTEALVFNGWGHLLMLLVAAQSQEIRWQFGWQPSLGE